jgi:drug/metabolite transporter (DMT)-like permease
MSRPRRLLGAGMVLLAAACYGVLASLVKAAYGAGYSPAEVVSAQDLIGAAVLALADFALARRSPGEASLRVNRRDRVRLMLAGTSIGFTGAFYYLAVSAASVSLAIVLLMQSVWMSVVVEAVIERRAPSLLQILAAGLVIVGAALATNVGFGDLAIGARGLAFGLLAAISNTVMIWCSGHVASSVHPIRRSALMMVGGAAVVLTFAAPTLLAGFDFGVIWPWGLIIALLGTILPTFLFNFGAPLAGAGLTAIVSSAELPVAIIVATVFLGEAFAPRQWAGVALIVAAIALSNLRRGD